MGIAEHSAILNDLHDAQVGTPPSSDARRSHELHAQGDGDTIQAAPQFSCKRTRNLRAERAPSLAGRLQ